MDAQTRSRYSSLLNEDWAKLGYLREDDIGLKRNFHPLFQRTNASRPSGAHYVWPQYKSEDEYEAMCAEMGTVFQITSNILETPKSLDFLYQVANSPRKVSKTGLGNQGRPCREFGWNEPMTEAIGRSMAKDALRRLSHSLSFQTGDPEANPAVRGAIAVTAHTLVNFPKGVKINEAGKSGMASRITLNQVYILKLRELAAQEGDTTSQRMSIQAKLAITLCHEIAHALAFAVDSELLEMAIGESNAYDQAHREGRAYQFRSLGTDEPFYKNERMAEIGNCWENQVFGGKISWSGETNDPLFVSKWPSFFTSDNGYPKRGKEKRTARKYVVSRHFVRNLHRQAFWDNVKPEHTNALYIKKTIGIEYSNPDVEAQSVNSSENNWPHDEDSSRVSRERDGQPVKDPSDSHANETGE